MYRQSEKNLLSSNTASTCPDNMVNFGPLTAEICWRVWGTPTISTGFASWQCYCTASSSGRQPNFAALNRGRQLRSAGRPSGWALAHILVYDNLCSVFWCQLPNVLGLLALCSVITTWYIFCGKMAEPIISQSVMDSRLVSIVLLANDNSRSRLLYAITGLSVCCL